MKKILTNFWFNTFIAPATLFIIGKFMMSKMIDPTINMVSISIIFLLTVSNSVFGLYLAIKEGNIYRKLISFVAHIFILGFCVLLAYIMTIFILAAASA